MCRLLQVLDVSMKAIEPSYQGKCAFRKVDAQQNYKLAQHFKVSKLPTLLVFRAGVQASKAACLALACTRPGPCCAAVSVPHRYCCLAGCVLGCGLL